MYESTGEWLDALAPGDEVCSISRDLRAEYGYRTKVERCTKTLIITDNGGRYRKTDGCEPGQHGYYAAPYILPIDSERAVRAIERRVLRDLRPQLEGAIRECDDPERLRSALAVLRGKEPQ